jgi:hypothetical protein
VAAANLPFCTVFPSTKPGNTSCPEFGYARNSPLIGAEAGCHTGTANLASLDADEAEIPDRESLKFKI